VRSRMIQHRRRFAATRLAVGACGALAVVVEAQPGDDVLLGARPEVGCVPSVGDHESVLESPRMDQLVRVAVFGEVQQRELARWLVWQIGQSVGVRAASIHALYMARGRGEVSGFTVPAINLRTQTFDMARTVFEAADAADAGAVILELARSEQTYTYQRPIDYATAVLAGAVAAGWRGPVFAADAVRR
jgi:hypothetical protein